MTEAERAALAHDVRAAQALLARIAAALGADEEGPLPAGKPHAVRKPFRFLGTTSPG